MLHARSNRFSPVRRELRQNSGRKKEGLLRMKSVLNSVLSTERLIFIDPGKKLQKPFRKNGKE